MLAFKIVIVMVVAMCLWLIPFEEWELGCLYWLRTERPVSNKIWVVSIDEEIEKTNKPIPHDRYAQLVTSLSNQYNASQIGFDVVFAKDEENDAAFSMAVKRAGCVSFGMLPAEEDKSYSERGFSYPCIVKGETDRVIELAGLKNALSDTVLQHASGIGHIGSVEKKVVDSIPLIIKCQNKFYPSLVLQMAADYFRRKAHLRSDQIEIEVVPEKHIRLKERNTEEVLCQIPVDRECQMLVNFAEAGKNSFAFKVLSINDVLNLPTVEGLKGRIVLVGGTTNTTGDMYTTPFAPYPGIGVLANAMENIIDQRFLTQPLKGLGFILFPVVIALIGWGMSGRRFKWQMLGLFVGIGVYGFVVWLCFEYGVWLELLRPVAIWSGVMGWVMVEGKRRLEADVLRKEGEKKQLEMKVEENQREKLKIEQVLNEKNTEVEKIQAEAEQKKGSEVEMRAKIQQLEDKLSEMKEPEQKTITSPDLKAEITKAVLKTISDEDREKYSAELCTFLLSHSSSGFAAADYGNRFVSANDHNQLHYTIKNHLRLLVKKGIITRRGRQGYELHGKFSSPLKPKTL